MTLESDLSIALRIFPEVAMNFSISSASPSTPKTPAGQRLMFNSGVKDKPVQKPVQAPSTLEKIADEQKPKAPLPGQRSMFEDSEESPKLDPVHHAVGKRFGIPPEAVKDLLTTHPDELARRDDYYAPSSTSEPTTEYEKFPLHTARIAALNHRAGETNESYVDYLRQFHPNELKPTEPEDGIKKSKPYQDYLAWAKAGLQPPYINVYSQTNGNSQLVTSNRRRTLAAQEAGVPSITGWHGPYNPETGNPLKYGDVLKAAQEFKSQSFSRVLEDIELVEFARKPAAGQMGFDFEADHPRETTLHDGKRPGEFAPKEHGREERKGRSVGPAGLTPGEAIAKATNGKSDDSEKPLTHDQAVRATYAYTGTNSAEWSAVPVKGMAESKNEKGESVSVPEFEMPAGYSASPVLWKADAGGACCELCSHPIKNVYWIQNDSKKWTMMVGSECVTKFGEGESGERLAKKAVWKKNRDFLQETWDAFNKLGDRYGAMGSSGRHHIGTHSSQPYYKLLAEAGVKQHENEIPRDERKRLEDLGTRIWKAYNKLKGLVYTTKGAPISPQKLRVPTIKNGKDVGGNIYDAASDSVVSGWVKRNGDEARSLLEEVDNILSEADKRQFSQTLNDIGPVEFSVAYAAPPRKRRLIDDRRTSEDIDEDEQVTGKKKKVPTDRHEPETGWTKVGGSTVHVDDDGVIDKGCPGLKGEAVEDLIDESDESRERREARQAFALAAGITGRDVTAEQAKSLGSEKHIKAYKDAKAVAKDDPRPNIGTPDVLRGVDDQTGEPVEQPAEETGGNGDELWDSSNREQPAESNEQFQETGLPSPMKFSPDEDESARPEWMGPKLSEMVPIPPRPKFLRDREPVDHDAAESYQRQIDAAEEDIAKWREARDALAKGRDIGKLGLSPEELQNLKTPGYADNKIAELQKPLAGLKRKLSDYRMRTTPNMNPANKTPWTSADQAAQPFAAEYGLPLEVVTSAMPAAYTLMLARAIEHEGMKKSARKITGIDAGDVERLTNSGRDWRSVIRFDETSRDFVLAHPESHIDPADPDVPEKVWNLISEGAVKLPAKDSPEVADTAAQMVAADYHRAMNEPVVFKSDEDEAHSGDDDEWRHSPEDDFADTSFNPNSFSRSSQSDEIDSIAERMGVDADSLRAALAQSPGDKQEALIWLRKLMHDPSRGVIRDRNGRVIGFLTRNGKRIQIRDAAGHQFGTVTHSGARSVFRDSRGHVGGTIGEFSRSLDEIEPVEFGGQQSFDWSEDDHPRGDDGKFVEKLRHQIKEYLSDGSYRHLRDIHEHTGHKEHDAFDPLANKANKALKDLRDSGEISSQQPEYGDPHFYMTEEQIARHRGTLKKDEPKSSEKPKKNANLFGDAEEPEVIRKLRIKYGNREFRRVGHDWMLRAKKGGEFSEVNGMFYKGGQWMPIHGLSDHRKIGKSDEEQKSFEFSLLSDIWPVEFARVKPASGQMGFDFESSHPREASEHDGKRPGEFAPKQQLSPQEDWKQNSHRSAAFKSWFGDWENEPHNASKVVHSETGEPQETGAIEGTGTTVVRNGKPIAVYHGTGRGGFDQFDRRYSGRATASGNADHLLYGPGFYFTEDPDVAAEYAKIGDKEHYSTSLDREGLKRLAKKARKSLELEHKQWVDAGMENDAGHIKRGAEYLSGLERLMDIPKADIENNQDALRGLYHHAIMGGETPHGIARGTTGEVKKVHLNIRNPFDIDAKTHVGDMNGLRKKFGDKLGSKIASDYGYTLNGDYGNWSVDNSIVHSAATDLFGGKTGANDHLEKMGYDGITHIGGNQMGDRNHRVWIAFHPNQIKSVNNHGTFDPSDNRIEFSREILSIGPVEFARKPAAGQLGFDFEKPAREYERETSFHEGKKPGEFAPKKDKSTTVRDAQGRVVHPTTGQVQARSLTNGGEVSEVDGQHYKAGRWMPVHGLTPKVEQKAKPAERGIASAGKASEDAEKKRRYTEARVLSPEDLETAKRNKELQNKWDEMNSGPLGKVKWLGNSPNAKGMHWQTSMNGWNEFAEKAGGDEMKRIISELEPIWHSRVEAAAKREEERGQPLDSDTIEWQKNIPREAATGEIQMFPRANKFTEKHAPGSAYARQLVHSLLDTSQIKPVNPDEHPVDNMHKIHRILSGTYESEFSRDLALCIQEFGRHEFASTQLDLGAAGYPRAHGSPVVALKALADSIADEDLAEDGREDDPHITALFGLHADNPDEVAKLVDGFGAVHIKFGKTSVFPANEKRKSDVVKIDIEGYDIHRLNKLLRQLDHTSTYPDYHPHLTLAYVKPGMGEKYAGENPLTGKQASFYSLTFSGKDRRKTPINLLKEHEFSRWLVDHEVEFARRHRPDPSQGSFGWEDREQETPVDSSNVHSFAWRGSPQTGSLMVRFKAKDGGPGPLYQYHGTPYSLYDGMAQAASKGKFVWDELRVRGTVSGHQYPYSLVAAGSSGYVPRQAGLRRGYGGEHFMTRTLNGVQSQLAPGPVKKGPAKPIPGYDPNQLTLSSQNKQPSQPTRPAQQSTTTSATSSTPTQQAPTKPSTPTPANKVKGLVSRVLDYFRKKKSNSPKQFSREEWEAAEIVLGRMSEI